MSTKSQHDYDTLIKKHQIWTKFQNDYDILKHGYSILDRFWKDTVNRQSILMGHL